MLKKRIREHLDKTPMWVSFMALTAFFLLLLTLALSYYNYRWNRERTISQTVSGTERILNLKMQGMESYLNDLSEFCVLPVNDSAFYYDLHKTKYMNSSQLNRIMDKVEVYYYTRSDLTAYHLYLLNQHKAIGRGTGDQRMKITTESDVTSRTEYLSCLTSPTGSALLPCDDGSLFSFYHSIIRIETREPIALVGVEVTPAALTRGLDSMRYALYRQDGCLLYTNMGPAMKETLEEAGGQAYALEHKDSSLDSSRDENISIARAYDPDHDGIATIGGEQYLIAESFNERYGLRLLALMPLSEITDSLDHARRFSLLEGFLFLLISLVITYITIHFLTSPLAKLSESQDQFGRQDFDRIAIGRSREVVRLSDSYNRMSERIEKLVRENLVSKINEKTAQLTALEAQVNPHFLYNTLQAIGSEALMNDQPGIYDMLTRLARNLRYSIKAPNEVTLGEEIDFVKGYVALLKIRMDERLDVNMHIDPALSSLAVPKLLIQPLVENAIKHGIQGEITGVRIDIESYRQRDALIIRVADNGAGMSADTLKGLQASLREERPDHAGESIGLANLYHRLQIMYGDRAQMTMDSAPGQGTRITIQLQNS